MAALTPLTLRSLPALIESVVSGGEDDRELIDRVNEALQKAIDAYEASIEELEAKLIATKKALEVSRDQEAQLDQEETSRNSAHNGRITQLREQIAAVNSDCAKWEVFLKIVEERIIRGERVRSLFRGRKK